MTKRVLVVAYYFPPMGGSGVQRVAKLVKHLPRHGWAPEVLTAEPGGYLAFDPSLLEEVERAGVPVHRTPSWDPTRLFRRQKATDLPREDVRRRASEWSQYVFIPDNKIGWAPHALQAGRRLLAERSFDAVFASAPPYTALLVAARLSRISDLPFVADFRDDWLGNPRHVYPTSAHRWLHRRLERYVLQASHRVLTINPFIQRRLRASVRAAKAKASVEVLPQGFDPEDFEETFAARLDEEKCRFLYSGLFYDAQTPDFFLRGLAALGARRPEVRGRVEAAFVGLLPEASRRLAERLGMIDLVRYEGYLPHREAVAHLRAADVLWMTIGARPGAEGISTGKLFEYMGARKPILALVPPGVARDALEPYGAARVAYPDDVAAIAAAIEGLFDAWQAGTLPQPDEAYVQRFNREGLAQTLAGVLSRVD